MKINVKFLISIRSTPFPPTGIKIRDYKDDGMSSSGRPYLEDFYLEDWHIRNPSRRNRISHRAKKILQKGQALSLHNCHNNPIGAHSSYGLNLT